MDETLSPYQPTWRDRVANLLMGTDYERPSPSRRALVEGLVGSSGLGNTGMSVSDLTPVGGVLGLQEDAQHGNKFGMALNAASLIPGAAVAKAVEKAAPAASDLAKGIIAYHGSPHSFDRFDLSKIGTGEGAQAYGHGLYFAEAEPVAQGYKLRTSAQKADLALDGNPLQTQADWFGAQDKLNAAGDWRAAKALDEIKTQLNRGYNKHEALTYLKDWHRNDPAMVDAIEGMRDRLSVDIPKGNMYQVRINADPAHFLDWDKPLEQQHPVVQQAIQKVVGEPDPYISSSGEKFWQEMSRPALASTPTTNAVEASSALRDAGIPGIKYLDAGSRSAGDGSRNYVVFNDQLIDILKKYGLAGLGAGVGASTFMGGAPGMAPQSAQASTDW